MKIKLLLFSRMILLLILAIIAVNIVANFVLSFFNYHFSLHYYSFNFKVIYDIIGFSVGSSALCLLFGIPFALPIIIMMHLCNIKNCIAWILVGLTSGIILNYFLWHSLWSTDNFVKMHLFIYGVSTFSSLFYCIFWRSRLLRQLIDPVKAF
jgi:hypothetical protein